MALIDELKEKQARIRAEHQESRNKQDAVHREMDEQFLALNDLARAIAALEAPAQPVHPEAELRSVPGAEEEVRDHILQTIATLNAMDNPDRVGSLIDAQTCEEVDPRVSWKAEPAPCTCHPDDAPLECMKRYAASECHAAYSAKYFPIPAEEVPPQTYEDEADLAPEPEALDEPVQDEATTDLWQQGYDDKLNGYEPSLAEPDYLKGYADCGQILDARKAADEQASFFAKGMMADADRHAKHDGPFAWLRKREDA